jgi:hypothetical protein
VPPTHKWQFRSLLQLFIEFIQVIAYLLYSHNLADTQPHSNRCIKVLRPIYLHTGWSQESSKIADAYPLRVKYVFNRIIPRIISSLDFDADQ